jgi:ketosteroid isomerase-like protein
VNKPAVSLGALLKSNDDPLDSPTGRRAAKDAILAFFKAIAAKDAAALARSITEDAVYEIPFSESGSTEPGAFRRYVGAAEVIEFWTATTANGPKSLGPEDVELSITADGSRVFIEQRGNMVLSDGRSYRNKYVFRFSIRDGQICHVREYFNAVTAAYAFKRKIANAFLIETLETN